MSESNQVKDEINLDDSTSNCRYDPLPTRETDQVPKRRTNHRYLGFFYAILAISAQWLGNLLTRYLRDYRTSEIITYRVFMEALFIIPFMIRNRDGFTFQLRHSYLIVLRGTIMTFGYFLRVYAVQALPLGESNAILFSFPVATAILARFTLKDPFTNMKIMGTIANFFGLVLVSRLWNGLDLQRALGLGAPLLNVIIEAVSTVVLKKLSLELSPKQVVFHMSWMRFVYMAVITEIRNDWTLPSIPKCEASEWYFSDSILFVCLGISMLIFSIFFVEAVKLENASTVPAIQATTLLPLYLISQWAFFNEVPSVLVISGVFLVLLASIFINIEGIVEKLPSHSRVKIIVNRINK